MEGQENCVVWLLFCKFVLVANLNYVCAFLRPIFWFHCNCNPPSPLPLRFSAPPPVQSSWNEIAYNINHNRVTKSSIFFLIKFLTVKYPRKSSWTSRATWYTLPIKNNKICNLAAVIGWAWQYIVTYFTMIGYESPT